MQCIVCIPSGYVTVCIISLPEEIKSKTLKVLSMLEQAGICDYLWNYIYYNLFYWHFLFYYNIYFVILLGWNIIWCRTYSYIWYTYLCLLINKAQISLSIFIWLMIYQHSIYIHMRHHKLLYMIATARILVGSNILWLLLMKIIYWAYLS